MQIVSQKKGSRDNRQSNIELLRIVTALGVIVLHYNNPNIGGGFRFVEGTPNKLVLAFFQAAFICAVNLFILISGYFMRHSQKRDLLKPLELVIQLLVFESLFLLIKEIPNSEPLTFERAVSYYIPSYWFVFVYISIYLISPYLNIMWDKLGVRDRQILLSILLCIFSVYPIIMDMVAYLSKVKMSGTSTIGLDGAQSGYTIVNFVLMYLIGLYMRDKDELELRLTGENNPKSSKTALLLFLNILVVLIWSILDLTVFNRNTALIPAWCYQNPFVITEAILFFRLFKNMKIKNNKVINSLAAASFPSYLIHMNLLGYFGIKNAVHGNPVLLVLHIICCAGAIYLISYLMHTIYQLITARVFRVIDRRWIRRRRYAPQN
ncbi:MAG: acyltransferase [Eubacterium sp.]|nr:acyltransferase [Eubacterium sp.]